MTNKTAALTPPHLRPWRVRDTQTNQRFFYDTRAEAEQLFDAVCTDDSTGKPLPYWLKRMVVEPN